jgi:hypothetical protein
MFSFLVNIRRLNEQRLMLKGAFLGNELSADQRS